MNNTPNNQPYDANNYAQIEPSDVTAANQNYPGLILKQMERINYLLIMGTQRMATTGGIAQVLTVPELSGSIYRGLRSVESMLSPFLNDDNYYTEAKKVKKKIEGLDASRTPDEMFEALGQWYDLLILRLSVVDILPQKSVDLDLTDEEEEVDQL